MNTSNDFKVLDGAMGSFLISQYGVPRSTKVWSAKALIEPEYHHTIVSAHKDYINAGADFITTSNYSVTPTFYTDYYQDPIVATFKVVEHSILAAKLADKARNESGASSVKVFGCLPPRESYRPDLAKAAWDNPEQARHQASYYSSVVSGMEPFVDVFLLETMNSIYEVDNILKNIKTKKSIAVAMQGDFKDEITGTPRPELCDKAARYLIFKKLGGWNIDYFFLNCASPANIEAALQALTPRTKTSLQLNGIKLGVYPNAMEMSEETQKKFDFRQSLNIEGICGEEYEKIFYPKDLKDPCVAYILSTRRHGVSIFGGCCGMFPGQIHQLHSRLKLKESKL